MPQVKHVMNEPRYSKTELKVQAIARRRADNQLMRVPWPRFRRAYGEYPRWQALVLWVQAIMATQDSIPSWLVADVEEHCPGFIEHERSSQKPKLMARHLLEWIHNERFRYAKRQGWLDALTFYGARHPHSRTAWAYWEHCEEEWNRRRPSSYPDLEEWWRLAQNYNPNREPRIADFAGVVDRYVEWKIFSCWLEPLTRARIQLPKRLATELERRCPGFPEVNNSHSIRRRPKKASAAECLMTWVEDHFFAEAKKAGWLETARQQTRRHPLYARIVRYAKHWRKSSPRNTELQYPSFAKWRRTAVNYTEN